MMGVVFVVVLLLCGCGVQKPLVGDASSASARPTRAAAAPSAAHGPYEIPRELFEKHGIGLEVPLSPGVCPLVPVSLLADAIPGVDPADVIISTTRSRASFANEGTASMEILLDPERLGPHLLRTREVSCVCRPDGFECSFFRWERAFDENVAETFALEDGATLEEGLQVVRLYRAGAIKLMYAEEHPDDLESMRVVAVAREREGFKVYVANKDGNWGGMMRLRIGKTRNGPMLEVAYGEFGGV